MGEKEVNSVAVAVAITVAIDGGAGSGKSTVARVLAQKLNFLYLDSGALYRTLTLWWLQKLGWGESPEEFEKLFLARNKKTDSKNMSEIEIRIQGGSHESHIDGKNVTHLLRDKELTKRIKSIADDALSREYVNQILKRIAANRSVVIDGRDIATEVFPDADYKFFLEAPVGIRAKRRLAQREQKTYTANDLAMKMEIEALETRDYHDQNRPIGSLRKSEHAILIATGEKSIDQVVQVMWEKIAS